MLLKITGRGLDEFLSKFDFPVHPKKSKERKKKVKTLFCFSLPPPPLKKNGDATILPNGRFLLFIILKICDFC